MNRDVKSPFSLPNDDSATAWDTLIGSLLALVVAVILIVVISLPIMAVDAWVTMLAWNAWLAPVLHTPVLTFWQTFLLRIVFNLLSKSPSSEIVKSFSEGFKKKFVKT
jgi:hypothetical protein